MRVLNRLAEHSDVVELGKGEVVYREGARGESLFLVISGRCQSVIRLPDGSEQALDIFGPGDTFGERALLSQGTHWTSVHVVTDLVLLRLNGDDVLRVVDRTPRMAKLLVQQFRENLHSPNESVGTVRSGLGRVVAVSSVAESIIGRTMAGHLTAAIRHETRAGVLFVRVMTGADAPQLGEGNSGDGKADVRRHIHDGGEGFGCLTLFVNQGGDFRKEVAPTISHLARHYQFVVIATDNQVDAQLMEEFQKQADLSYVLFGQSPDDLYRANLFMREIRSLFHHGTSHIRPVVCLVPGERSQPFVDLEFRLGAPIHAVVHNLPKESAGGEHEFRDRGDCRFATSIRYLAREIARCRVGIALSAGGAKAFAHIGVLRVLAENGIHVDVVAGTSMGAYVGALYAYGLTPDEIEPLAWKIEGRFGLLRVFDPALPPNRGFMKGHKFRRMLELTLGDANFSDMRLPLRVVATDLATLERVVHDSGQVSLAVHTSMAMPGIVVPVELNGRTYVDGAASEPLPVNVLMEMGVERIIAVNTIPNTEEMTACATTAREQAQARRRRREKQRHGLQHLINAFDEGNILDIFMSSMHALQTRVVEGACKQADVVLRPVVCNGRWNDFENTREFIEHGAREAEKNLDALLALVDGGR